MKAFVEEVGNYLHKHLEESIGASVGAGLGIKHIAETQTDNIYLQVIIVAVLAFVGGVSGALGKWAIEAIRNKFPKDE